MVGLETEREGSGRDLESVEVQRSTLHEGYIRPRLHTGNYRRGDADPG